MGVEDLISSYLFEHAKSNWSSIGMGGLIFFGGQFRINLKLI